MVSLGFTSDSVLVEWSLSLYRFDLLLCEAKAQSSIIPTVCGNIKVRNLYSGKGVVSLGCEPNNNSRGGDVISFPRYQELGNIVTIS